MPSSMPSSISWVDPHSCRAQEGGPFGRTWFAAGAGSCSERRRSGERHAGRLRKRRAGERVLRQETGQGIIDRIELLRRAGVQVRSRLGLGEAALSNGFQSLPLVVVALHRSDNPVHAMARTPVCGAIGAQDLRCSMACPAKAKRVQGERGSADNQQPADEVVPSGLQELHGRLHWGSTLDGLPRPRRTRSAACGATTRNARTGQTRVLMASGAIDAAARWLLNG
jgi:hypothetical protein